MYGKYSSKVGVALASLLLFWIASLGSPAAAQTPNVTIVALEVNGVPSRCGATLYPGDQACLDFSIDQPGDVFIFDEKTGGTARLVLLQFNVAAGEYLGCLPPEGSDTGPRTITVLVTNANSSGLNVCNYTLAATPTNGPGPTVSIRSLLVNGVRQPCGSGVFPGDQVCVLFITNQSGFATVWVTKNGNMTPVASGFVTAGTTLWEACVTAGSDSALRTVTVQVENTNGTGQDTCGYNVQ